jgi:hypothetical protein
MPVGPLCPLAREFNTGKPANWITGQPNIGTLNLSNLQENSPFQGNPKPGPLDQDIYFLWSTGTFTNQQIGELMGLS